MQPRLYRISRSTTPIVSLADMKKHLRVDHSDDDTLIEGLIAEITDHLDGEDGILNRAILDQTWDMKIEGFPCGEIEIPLPPLISVASIGYYDDADALQTLPEANYHSIGASGRRRARIVLKSEQSWPSVYYRPEAVAIRFRAGYMNMTDSPPVPNVPGPIKAAIKLLVGTRYEHRESIIIGQTAVQLPWAADELLRPFYVFA